MAALKLLSAGGLPKQLKEVRPLDRPDLSFEPIDSMVMEAVYWFGAAGYEGHMSDVWPRLCASATSILEIGSNVGFYTVLGGTAARGAYTAVEPLPELVSVVRQNLKRNNLEPRVELLHAAAIPDAEAKDVLINIPDEKRSAPVGAHLVEGVGIAQRSTARQITVPGLPFAQLFKGRDLVKIDAEGIEVRLLSSVRSEILKNKPTLVLEVLPEAVELGSFIAEIATEAGMTITVVPAYGTHKICTVSPSEFNSQTPLRFNSKDIVLSVGMLGS